MILRSQKIVPEYRVIPVDHVDVQALLIVSSAQYRVLRLLKQGYASQQIIAMTGESHSGGSEYIATMAKSLRALGINLRASGRSKQSSNYSVTVDPRQLLVIPNKNEKLGRIGIEHYFRDEDGSRRTEIETRPGWIVPNPHGYEKPLSFDLATETVKALAAQIRDTEDFSVMPILADALQDAGCADEQLLWECRTEFVVPPMPEIPIDPCPVKGFEPRRAWFRDTFSAHVAHDRYCELRDAADLILMERAWLLGRHRRVVDRLAGWPNNRVIAD